MFSVFFLLSLSHTSNEFLFLFLFSFYRFFINTKLEVLITYTELSNYSKNIYILNYLCNIVFLAHIIMYIF